MNNHNDTCRSCGARMGEVNRRDGGCACGRGNAPQRSFAGQGACSNRGFSRRENGGGNGCTCGDCASAQCKQWMRKLQQLDFALQELTLYLDVYPECSRALEQFRRLRDEREGVLRELQAQCGPVYATGNRGDRWEWTDSPWPWQNDFVGNSKGQL